MDRVLAGGTEAKPARILFVDDEPRVRAAFARVMEAEGFHVDLAANGAEALRLAELHTYPVVATDLAMPEMDGISLIRQLHLKDAATVFVIVTSASVVQVPTDAQLRDHVSSIVTKPFAVQELVETLNRSIHLWESRSSRRSPASEAPADSILLIEDDDADAELVSSFLRCTRHRGKVVRVRRLNEAIQALEEDRFGVILTDLSLPDARGLDVVLRIQNTTTDTPLIVLSGQSANGVAVQALQAGAQDYLIKGGVDGAALVRSIQYARERKRSEQELAQLAHFDPLTGLANRAQFKQRLDSTFARARRMQEPFAVLFLDLDGFKPINDDYGHAAGDALLVEVSRRLEETLREYDIVARLGGDEFAIVLDKLADQNEAELIARRMLKVIAKPHRLDDIEVRVTASIGIAMHPEDGATASDLV
ncbi:MAG: diguanylate cyclase (GGDEF)-like protein, partial [Polyangiales bacterium]